MKQFTYIWIPFLLAIFVVAPDVKAQHELRNFGVEDGLPSSETYDVFQDSHGYIWICTDRGVSRYDGYRFENFTTNDGLTYNTVFRVFEDPDQNLWFMAFNRSITIWDRKTETFSGFEKNAELYDKLTDYDWVVTVGFKGDTINIFPIASPQISYIKSTGKLVTNEKEVDSFSISFSSNVLTVLRSNRNRPHFYFLRNDANLSNKEFDVLRRIIQKEFLDIKIIDIYRKGKRILISTSNGLYMYENLVLVDHFFVGEEISAAYIDHEQNVWLTTTHRGVIVVRLDPVKQIAVDSMLGAGEKIISMGSLGDNIILGTSKGMIFDAINKSLNIRVGYRNVRSDIHSIYAYKNKLYVSYGYVLSLDNESNWEVTPPPPSVRASFGGYKVMPINDTAIFYSRSNSFGISDSSLSSIQTPEYLARILEVCKTNYNTLIYSTFSGLFEVSNLDFDHPVSLNKSLELKNTTVRAIVNLKDSIVLLGTSGGGLIIQKNGKRLETITVKDNLPSNIINRCLVDTDKKRIWCCSNRGVSIIDYQIQNGIFWYTNITNLNKIHGLPSNYNQSLCLTSDAVYIASDFGLCKISRDFDLEPTSPPFINISSFLVNDSNRLHSSKMLKHNQNMVNIEFNAYSLQRPMDGMFYRYRMLAESIDTSWKYSNERGVIFNRLSPGKYTFMVSARSENSDWSPAKFISFEIKPAFLDRLPVQIVLIVSILGLIALLVWWYIQQNAKENEKTLALKNLEIKNSELELASLRGQMNPHFVFNALKSIQNLILNEEKWKANELLTRFSKLIRSTLEHTRTDFIPLKTEIDFLLNYLQIEKSRTPDRFEFSLDIDDVSDYLDLKIPGLVIQPLCENAIKHAFQNFKEMGHLRLTFAIDEVKECIHVTIEDDGIGYYSNKNKQKSSRNTSMGLEIVRSRIQILHQQGYEAEIKISPVSEQSLEGTVISLTLPYQ